MARSNIADLEILRELLRTRSLRATPARLAVLGVLNGSRAPITHLQVSDKLAEAGFEKSTVFRALADLTTAGLLRKMELGDHVWRFERIRTEQTEDAHPHLLCTDCGGVSCLDEDQVQLKVTEAVGPIEGVLLRGKCEECRE